MAESTRGGRPALGFERLENREMLSASTVAQYHGEIVVEQATYEILFWRQPVAAYQSPPQREFVILQDERFAASPPPHLAAHAGGEYASYSSISPEDYHGTPIAEIESRLLKATQSTSNASETAPGEFARYAYTASSAVSIISPIVPPGSPLVLPTDLAGIELVGSDVNLATATTSNIVDGATALARTTASAVLARDAIVLSSIGRTPTPFADPLAGVDSAFDLYASTARSSGAESLSRRKLFSDLVADDSAADGSLGGFIRRSALDSADDENSFRRITDRERDAVNAILRQLNIHGPLAENTADDQAAGQATDAAQPVDAAAPSADDAAAGASVTSLGVGEDQPGGMVLLRPTGAQGLQGRGAAAFDDARAAARGAFWEASIGIHQSLDAGADASPYATPIVAPIAPVVQPTESRDGNRAAASTQDGDKPFHRQAAAGLSVLTVAAAAWLSRPEQKRRGDRPPRRKA